MRLLTRVYGMMLYNVLRCVDFALTLVGTQHNPRIDSDPMLVIVCVAFLRQIVKILLKYLIINFAFCK